MIIHIPVPTPSHVPLNGGKTLCGKIIGSTHGIIPISNFINPIRGKVENKSYEVFYTKKGYDWLQKRAPLNNLTGRSSLYKDRGYWQGYVKGRIVNLCEHCQESDEFGMMVLAEL